MEKFQKYCLSVLLVIIYNNISAQVNNGSIEIDDCKKLYEIYHKFLHTQGCDGTMDFAIQKINAEYTSIGQKQNATDAFAGSISEKRQNSGHNFYLETSGLPNGKHDKVLENFKRQSKEYRFAYHIELKSKVSKIRNKDYLDLRYSLII
ncbi:hypothetical protein N6B72_06185 [Chryseobacterium soli]|uniref:hypothetical protein n=1 Tax=Chryseobacterium soli TaxID=445961 RepID=UPI0029557DB4|nr:hypothetical protein [Chryseobacterium soli]MDV7696506.1 hypothetical protein [Chryseobacterium soli]